MKEHVFSSQGTHEFVIGHPVPPKKIVQQGQGGGRALPGVRMAGLLGQQVDIKGDDPRQGGLRGDAAMGMVARDHALGIKAGRNMAEHPVMIAGARHVEQVDERVLAPLDHVP